ncbi:hypothetical protein ACLSU7_09710 [Bdellovibrio sp. HCB185ZH]|uniref:hypothetical protein n=1 Tax=Bdellovibrio sp. HCB185ZH TaxID=3394235 RepID=UPI0039A54FEF
MKLIFALLSLVSSPAFAAVTTIQQNLMPAVSQNEFNAGIVLVTGKGETDSSVDVERSGVLMAGSYYYGIAENQALGLDMGITSLNDKMDDGTDTVDLKTIGLNDINFRYKANFDLGMPTLYLSAGFNLSPGEKTFDTTTTDPEFNSASGQNALAVHSGMIFPSSVLNYGFSVGYTNRLDGKYKRKSNSSPATADLKGGSSMTVSTFVESTNSLHTNVSLNYSRAYSSYAQESDGVNIYSSSPIEMMQLLGSMRIAINEHIELMPGIAYQTYLNKDEINLKSYNELDFGFNARFVF